MVCAETTIPGFYASDYVHPDCRPFALHSGKSEALILLHGLTGTPNDFQDYAQAFASDFDVYVPLLPGHGSHICHLQHLTVRELMIPLPALMNYLAKHYHRIHLTGMSYGGILALAVALELAPTTLGLIAPAFHLMPKAERHMAIIGRTGLHRIIPRLRKTTAYRSKRFSLSNRYTYSSIALGPTRALHQLAASLIPRLAKLNLPVWHAHGDADDTTPLEANHQLLQVHLKRYDFHPVPEGRHIPTLGPTAPNLAQHHLAWLQRHTLD